MMAANPALAAACDAIEYRITSEWGDGHNAAVSLTTGSEGIDGWTVQFDLPGGSQVQNAWNVDWHQSGATFTGADWRCGLAAVSEDFSVRYSGMHAPGETVDFSLRSGETHLMLVVAATPSQHRDYPMWEVGVGDPFPYRLDIAGATPA